MPEVFGEVERADSQRQFDEVAQRVQLNAETATLARVIALCECEAVGEEGLHVLETEKVGQEH